MAAGLVHRVREADGDPQGALFLMHGRGVDENDLFGLLDELDPERRLLGVTPGGPLTNQPPGGRHWYAVERVGHPEPRTFLAGATVLAAFCDETLAERGLDRSRTVFGGFSQGAVMAYAVGLAAGVPDPAGVIAMSGFMADDPAWALDLEGHASVPIWISHGSADPIISLSFAEAARARLEEAGVTVSYRESPVGHGIDPRLLGGLRTWLSEALAPD